ncbi:MAG: SDR family NAD(P)-dependent oxidoreductase [Acidimicrobiia bacterium]|nr:SDR family NAD(P)-dependent oxidoreductase [Acidimicrobiia bacterium]
MAATANEGRVALITGANSGIGFATVRALAETGATVLVAGRSPVRVRQARDDIRSSTGSRDVHEVHIDLSSLTSVREAAARVLDGWARLDVLVNNAGVVLSDRCLSEDGYELTFATNHVGPFLLTELLLDRLKASAPSRIVVVTSALHRGLQRQCLEDLQAEKSYSAMSVYRRTKLLNLLFTTDLAERLAGTGVSVFAVNPGSVRSRIARDGDAKGLLRLGMTLSAPFSLSARAGAAPSVHAATATGIEGFSGGYWHRSVLGVAGPIRRARVSPLAANGEEARRLRATTEELIRVARPAETSKLEGPH